MLKTENKGYEKVNNYPRKKGKFASKYEEPMTKVSVRLPQNTLKWIDSLAEQKGMNRIEVIRQLLNQEHEKQSGPAKDKTHLPHVKM